MLHTPGPFGLYDPASEHDACGVAFVADMHGRADHDVVAKALSALANMEHRGGLDDDGIGGDGAGILVQIPDGFFRHAFDADLPPPGSYATGIGFLPADEVRAAEVRDSITKIAQAEGLRVIGWRRVPVDDAVLGATARASMPSFWQIFVADAASELADLALERRVYVLRMRTERELVDADGRALAYFPSMSARTIVYKGMCASSRLEQFFTELTDERLASAIAVVHSRFSTGTSGSWPLAHPFRYVAHNGEFNTVRGNRNWMLAREGALAADDLGTGALERVLPVCTPGMSDSANFDEVLELLYLAGRPIHHAILMMIPAAWENDETMPPAHRAFFAHHASLMEPWDGPATVAFTDGVVVGAVLDRNGLRPGRYVVTDDGLVVMASEAGVVAVDPAHVVQRGRVRPGRMLLVDTAQGQVVRDHELKDELAAQHPYEEWVAASLVSLEDLPDRPATRYPHSSVVRRQQTFGYTTEELKWIVVPMALRGTENIGSMGSDTPVAVLSERPRLLFDYFSQIFAQGANPPLDANREAFVTSMRATIGADGNLLDASSPTPPRVVLSSPVIDDDELAKLVHIDDDGTRSALAVTELSMLYPVDGGGGALQRALDELCAAASRAVRDGRPIIVLSDRGTDATLAPIPSLLATSAVHHHLVRERLRSDASIIVETGDAREIHHFAALVAYGASAVDPYLVLESIRDLADRGMLADIGANRAIANYVRAASKGVLGVMAKMGICTLASYHGSQMFEAFGLSHHLIEEYFTGTTSKLGGIGLDELAIEIAQRHRRAYLPRPDARAHRELEGGGEYQWRREGEVHLFNPQTVFKLQHGTRQRRYDIFQQYTRAVDDQAGRLATLRGMFRFREEEREPVPIDEVEPVSEIVRRFATGAMSYGSISQETHETLAVAMNRIGGKSNSGEGGESPDRLYDPERRSAIKQVASARFGVTAEYLTAADDIQIKVAQGAKPGEGGHLPGHKVYPWIAEVRHSTPGVGLISPPTHHDVNSIEDSGELIFALKNANPDARIHVKLVAQSGVGTVAAAAAKSGSDVVLISGHDGGTGAAPLTALKHAGGLWELGLAETQQTLLASGLRDRILVQVDGQLKTGRDVMIATLLGAEEFGFATAPLVVSGCIMMRVCHLNTCPVGIATQDPVLRERYTGTPEFVETFFEYIAEEVRELLARLGLRTIDEAVGRVELLDVSEAVGHYKTAGLDLSPVLTLPDIDADAPRRSMRTQDHGLQGVLDRTIIADARDALDNRNPVRLAYPVTNTDRAVGTLLGHEVTKRHRGDGLGNDTIDITLTGTAGQALGAFLPPGVTLRLEGDANDHLGKGLSGGRIIVRPARDAHAGYIAEENTIAGNVIGYGATGGELFLRGRVGERFLVRNSGATAVVEGVGNHACEYMTGGRAVVLGPTGRNFGAGMSGGIAYVWDPTGRLEGRLNTEMVTPEDLDDLDRTWLVSMIYRHREATGSQVADRLLADWTFAEDQFVKVMPRDYARVLRAIAQAEEDGTDIEEAIMAAAAG